MRIVAFGTGRNFSGTVPISDPLSVNIDFPVFVNFTVTFTANKMGLVKSNGSTIFHRQTVIFFFLMATVAPTIVIFFRIVEMDPFVIMFLL